MLLWWNDILKNEQDHDIQHKNRLKHNISLKFLLQLEQIKHIIMKKYDFDAVSNMIIELYKQEFNYDADQIDNMFWSDPHFYFDLCKEKKNVLNQYYETIKKN